MQQGRLTRSVVAENGNDLALLHRQIDAPHDDLFAISRDKTADLQDSAHWKYLRTSSGSFLGSPIPSIRSTTMPRYESPYDPASMSKNLEHVIYEKRSHVVYVTISRPEHATPCTAIPARNCWPAGVILVWTRTFIAVSSPVPAPTRSAAAATSRYSSHHCVPASCRAASDYC
jgi:hypothetical protein